MRCRHFHFDPVLKRMSTVDQRDGGLWVDSKGAPELLLPSCSRIVWGDGHKRPLGPHELREVETTVEAFAQKGLRVLGIADRSLAWLWHYNHHRKHSALSHQPPVVRLNERTNLRGLTHRQQVIRRTTRARRRDPLSALCGPRAR